ncbi:MAG: YihY family inner membrane protein [Candidatus Omnitrophota bacterium]|nr:MAG: YihY family inner membrane protein [Candidatus Omnitrophota bacterium]
MKIDKNTSQKIVKFLTTDIWRIRLQTLSGIKSFLIKYLRMVLLALRGFAEDKCQLQASALTFYSLLSIVPVLAMAFGVAKGFGFENMLEKQLIDKMPGQEEVITQVIGFARTMLENTRGGLIAGIGIALLFWTVIKVLGTIENSFNDIWGVKKARSIARKFSDYLAIMVICPLLFIMASSVTVAISSQVTRIVQTISVLGPVSHLIMGALNFLPYVVIWIVFTFVYKIMPNTKVNFSSAAIAGIIAGTIYQFVQWVYITFQIGVSKFNAIYGSFAALPMFLIWLQLSWRIVLLGAEISFSHQNVETYEFEPDCLNISYSFKKLLTLRLMHLLVKDFSQAEMPPSDRQIAQILDMPIRLVRQILFELVNAGLVSELKLGGEKGVAYQPSHDTSLITIKHVIDALEQKGEDVIPIKSSPELDRIAQSLRYFSETIEKAPSNILLKEI